MIPANFTTMYLSDDQRETISNTELNGGGSVKRYYGDTTEQAHGVGQSTARYASAIIWFQTGQRGGLRKSTAYVGGSYRHRTAVSPRELLAEGSAWVMSYRKVERCTQRHIVMMRSS